MSLLKSKKSRDIAGSIAAIIFALGCLIAAAYHVKVLIDLNERGIHVSAVVVDMERGARNSSWAVYHYITVDGRETTARDTFQQYLKRVEKGDSVSVIYDRNDIKTVTADLGIWIWQAPVIFVFGFLCLAVLAYLIWRHRNS